MYYEGNNTELIFDATSEITGIVVYEEKIWYNNIQRLSDKFHRSTLEYYDMRTGDVNIFENGGIGLINNGYMYYNNSDNILRFNLSNFECESILKAEAEYITAFDFHKNYILYASGDSVYRFDDNENKLIFSLYDYFDKNNRIKDIQCQDDRIFIKILSGDYEISIIEIDINGNIIEVIHED